MASDDLRATGHPFDLLLDFDHRSRDRARNGSPELELPTGMVGRLALRLQDQRLMVSMQDISQIIPVPAITRVPGTQPWLMGIANLRGTVISVVNLGEFLLGKASNVTKSSRIVTVVNGDWLYGLLIDEVIGMRHFADHSLIDLRSAGAVSPELEPYVTEVYEGEQQRWQVFDVNVLLSNAYFLDAAA